MGQQQAKVETPNANVVNDIEIIDINLKTIETCLIILTAVVLASFALNIYSMHNKQLKKRYTSRATDLDKV